MIWIVATAGVFYVLLIAGLLFGWEKLKPIAGSPNPHSTFVSVIIPMRNEEVNIKRLLHCLVNQNYPSLLFEIIVVDDHSGDDSLKEAMGVKNESIQVVELPSGVTGKKNALSFGIQKSRGELILTSDADCSAGRNWIASLAGYFEKYQPVMMLGPVCGIYTNLFSKMQALEMYSLLGSTAGAASVHHPIMCNGANLAFSRKIYPDLKQVYENENIKSGDDMFVLQLLKKKYPKQIHFLKSTDCLVRTNLSENLRSFLRQRRRWAGKAVYYNDPDILLSGFIVLFINLLLLVSFLTAVVTSHYIPFASLFLTKSVIDFIFLYRITGFFGEKRLIRWFPLVQCFYFLYVCFTVLSSVTVSNQWKERTMKH